MSIRNALIALAATIVGLVALPAAASAYYVNYSNPNFTIASEGTTALKTPSSTISCETAGGSGSFANPHEGSVKLNFNKCKAEGTNCTTSGKTAGVIETTTLNFHVVNAKDDTTGSEGPGVLITPNDISGTKHFASFSCVFGLVSIKVEGNGVIGTLSSPGVTENASEFTLSFQEGADGTQTDKTAESTTENGIVFGTEYDLTAVVNGNPETGTQVGNGLIKFENGEEAEIVDAETP